ncbi:efflux RND transporter permease subunit [Wenzhouxiangella limi]|uniref:Efflux RND transporter permease subunit n=1 Tax=Wenzhouxiangella limi TaxID=2707351 RepID=A0A845UY97_9GAMM|nr:efflux RND transporter permease subunit [Wenzhouxiangella limi]NDY96813.1 efflux RND transporter permease subunit [Wenzhouxiangella limi]
MSAEAGGSDAGRNGVIGWVIANPVAANLVMLVFLIGGLLSLSRVQQEVFPEAVLDVVRVTVPYPGGTPEEVEEGIVLAVEEAMRGVDGIDEIRSVAREGQGQVSAELARGASVNEARNDIESAVNRITSFPENAEQPIISAPTNRRQVLSLILYGEVGRQTLRATAEQARRDLLRDPRLAQVELAGLPQPEIAVEVEQAVLREFGLTRSELARRIDQASVELPAGDLETATGDYLLRIMERRERGEAFADITIIARPDGTRITLGEIAEVVDGFRETGQATLFNGREAVRLEVYRSSAHSPLEGSRAVHEYVERMRREWPSTLKLHIWDDASIIFKDRIDLLVENGLLGLLLVLLILTLFLRPRLSFWVTVGLAVALLGSFLFMPLLGVSINMISLFAFILVLGVVVDDAIVVGEASFHYLQGGDSAPRAALKGTREVLKPVVFAVLTTIVAFVPLLFLPGVLGEFFRVIPLIVIPILLLSLMESFLVLPAHLAHMRTEERRPWLRRAARWQQSFSERFESLVEGYFRPFVGGVVRWRYFTIVAGFALLLIAIGYVASGRIAFRFMPEIESDIVTANIQLPVGAPVEETRRVARRVVDAIDRLQEQAFDAPVVEGVLATIGSQDAARERGLAQAADSARHLAAVAVSLVPAGQREVSAADVVRGWQDQIGEVAGVDKLSFAYRAGPGQGPDIAFRLAHEDLGVLREAAAEFARAIGGYAGVSQIDDGFVPGKPQIELRLKPAARALGVTELDLARQVRGAFFGQEALRTQRGTDELRVYVRRAPDDRRQVGDLLDKIILTPGGGEIPLREAAEVEYSRSRTVIEREQGQRVVNVTARVDRAVTSAGKVNAGLRENEIPELQQRFAGLRFDVSGVQQDQRESLQALAYGMVLAVIVMYGLLAVVFSSYAQPVLILLAVPFGFLGALLGHLLMGFDLSLISMFGLVALAGVVVNDSLILIVTINQRCSEGQSIRQAVIDGTLRRFRPVLLTSLTTFFGLAPMIFETSLQARFLIPMALSLGFGILFVTVIALIMVPALYCALEDARAWWSGTGADHQRA